MLSYSFISLQGQKATGKYPIAFWFARYFAELVIK